MKKTSVILSLLLSTLAFSQIRIGQSSATNLSSTSVLLEFGDTKDKGVILPYVETLPTADGGTLVFDASANGEYKVKFKNQNAGWTDLSVQSGYSTTVASKVKDPQATPLADATSATTIMGAASSSADGVLVLESSNKAMVLPIVEDYTLIKNPSPGMMAFIKHPTDSTKHRLIVFNGQTWAFWKP